MSSTFEDVNINLYPCGYVLYVPVRACVYSFQSRPSSMYLCFIFTLLNLYWAVFNGVLMWLPVKIYGILNIVSTFTTSPVTSHISNTQLYV